MVIARSKLTTIIKTKTRTRPRIQIRTKTKPIQKVRRILTTLAHLKKEDIGDALTIVEDDTNRVVQSVDAIQSYFLETLIESNTMGVRRNAQEDAAL